MIKNITSRLFFPIFRFLAIALFTLAVVETPMVFFGQKTDTRSLSDAWAPGVALAAVNDPAPAGVKRWPHEKSDLLPDPAIVYGRLDNGFRYVLMNNKKPENRVSIHLDVQAGSLNEQDHEQGVAHFLEHMLFNGSRHFKPGELVKYFQSIGMDFGADANAHTGFDETVYDIILPAGDKKHIDDALTVMRDYADGALLLQEEVDRELKVVLAEMRTRDSASYRTFISTLGFEFADSIIPKRLPIGKKDILEKADARVLRDFYEKWYRQDNMVLVLVGEFDMAMAKDLIQQKFGDFRSPGTLEKIPDVTMAPHKGLKGFYHYEKEAGGTSVSLEVIKQHALRSDSIDLQKEKLLKSVAIQIVQNRLDARIKKPDAPFTSAGIGSGDFLGRMTYSEISADCDPANWQASIRELEQTLRRARLFGFTVQEVERVKKDYRAAYETAVKKAPTRSSRQLSRAIIRHINTDRVFHSPAQERDLFMPFINSMTIADINSAFADMWPKDNTLVVVTGNADLNKGDDTPSDRIVSVFKQSLNIAVKSQEDEDLLSFPYLAIPKKSGDIISRKEIAELGITTVNFGNGIKLNLKKTDFKANEIVSSMIFGNGQSSEPEAMPGLSTVVGDVINESGFGGMDGIQLECALAGKNTSVGLSVSEAFFSLSGKTITDELELLFQLYYTYLKDPGLRKDALDLTLKRLKQEYGALSRSVEGQMKIKGKRLFAGGDSRFGLPEYEQLCDITIDSIKDWLKPPFINNDIEFSIVGDFDPEAVIEMAGRYLGSLEKQTENIQKNRADKPHFPSGQHYEIKVDTKIQKALVVVAWPTEDFMNIKRTRRFSILADLFSERLRVRIREKLGAAYSPFAFNMASRAYDGYGALYTYVHVAPDQIETVLAEIEEIAKELHQKGVSEDELKRSLDPVLTSIKEMRKTNRYWLNSVLKGSTRHPQQLNWTRTILNDYKAISTKEIYDLASAYLDNDKLASVIIKPEQPSP